MRLHAIDLSAIKAETVSGFDSKNLQTILEIRPTVKSAGAWLQRLYFVVEYWSLLRPQNTEILLLIRQWIENFLLASKHCRSQQISIIKHMMRNLVKPWWKCGKFFDLGQVASLRMWCDHVFISTQLQSTPEVRTRVVHIDYTGHTLILGFIGAKFDVSALKHQTNFWGTRRGEAAKSCICKRISFQTKGHLASSL